MIGFHTFTDMAADILEKEENRDDVKPMSIMESSAGDL